MADSSHVDSNVITTQEDSSGATQVSVVQSNITESSRVESVVIGGGKGDKGDTGATGATGAKGDKGDTGDTGPAGSDGTNGTNGTDGVGVPTAGTTGQVLNKASNTNYDTAWHTPVKGDVGLGNVDNTSDATKNSASASLTNKDLTSGTNTFPTLNQNTTGSAAKWTTARNLAGNSVDGSAAVAFANKFIVQGTTDTGLSSAQFLGSLATGLVKNTTTTGVLSIATAGTDYTSPSSTETLTNKTYDTAGTGNVLKINGTTVSDKTGSGKVVLDTSPTIVTPTVASFANANHNHTNSAGGGTLAESALALTDVTTNNANTSNHGFLPKLDGSTTTFLRGDGAFATPSGSGDVSSNTASSVDSEVALFNSTTGKSIKRASATGIAKLASGVLSAVTAPSGTIVGDTDSQTLTNKTLTTPVINGTITGTGQDTAATASTIVMRDVSGNLSAVNLMEGFTTTATAAGTTTLTIASTEVQVFTGSTTQTVKLPTTSVPAGCNFTIINQSTGAVTVQSSGANTITILAAGTSGVFTAVVATPTTAANWNAQYFGIVSASGKKLTVSNTITLAGTDSTTMTFPTTSATIARTDAANTFTGVQTLSSAPVLSTGTLTVSGTAQTFPTSAQTLVGRTTTDTLTNKTITSTTNSVSSAILTNPYKFSVYRNSALTPSGTALLSCDTKEYDTGTNVDVVTNKGRFTAPVNGFYHFQGQITGAASARGLVFLYKNGSEFKRGTDIVGGGGGMASCVSADVQATAGDYFEIFCNTGSTALTVGNAAFNYFQGFLISIT